MSFFSNLRRAFGFSADAVLENESDNLLDDDVSATPAAKQGADAPAAAPSVQTGVVLDAVFKHVVDEFNKALPDFLARSVDPEAQRRLLYDKLDQGLKDMLAQAAADTAAQCEARWSAEQARQREELESIKHKSEQLEHERSELKQKQLSADRQKRAMSDRLKDLETQIGALEAEREQLDLENKSLLNKLKVAAVSGAAVEIDAQAPLQEEVAALRAECQKLTEQLQQASEQQEIAAAIEADLRQRLKVANQEVDDLHAIAEQVPLVQKAIEERDEKIQQQRDNIRRLKEQIDHLSSIPAQTAAPTPTPTEAERPARKHPRRKAPEKKAEELAQPKITDDDLKDVESVFADAPWSSVAEPPASTAASDDFGYHAPEPKPRPYDDGFQLSLFD